MQYVREKKVMNHLQDYLICNIDIEKSSTALSLEKEYGIEWGFDSQTPLDSFFHLRACIKKPIKINSGAILPIPTGIYPQLKNPNFELEIRSYSTAIYEQGLALAEGITYFPFTFRNEIWLLIENKFLQAQIIQPAQKIALLSVKLQPRMVINYVDQIEQIDIKIGASKSYIQKIKKDLDPDVYDRQKEKLGNQLEYTRDDIDKYIEGTDILRNAKYGFADGVFVSKGSKK